MLSRVDNLTQSIQDHIRDFLDGAGYASHYSMDDDYPADRQNPLDKTIIVIRHDQSDEAEEGELGGPLALEEITYMCDVLGKDMRWGRNIAALIKEKLEDGTPIALNDYSQEPPSQVDTIPYIDGAIHSRMSFPNPFPWQQHWNVVAFRITLEYNRSAL